MIGVYVVILFVRNVGYVVLFEYVLYFVFCNYESCVCCIVLVFFFFLLDG